MPHFGLMDPDALGEERAALMRAKLHIRAGRRRLRQGKVAYGILTLSDALSHAMQWHTLAPALKERLRPAPGEDLLDDRILYAVLVRTGVLDGSFDYGAFDSLVERALDGEMAGFDYRATLEAVEAVMLQLGVMPFDEASLPPEDPATY